MIETLIPKDEQDWLSMRRQDVTSTEVSALFGCNPYMTEFELWHRKHDNLAVVLEQNERMKWGNRLQDSIAAGIAEDNNWTIRRMAEYIHNTELRLGASFDFEYIPVDDGKKGGIVGDLLYSKSGIFEVKNVDSLAFKDGWIVDGDDVQAPPHIEIQVQVQLALSKKHSARIGTLIGGNHVVLIEREPDEVVIAQIRKKVSEFWDSVKNNQEPKPDFNRDAHFIQRLYSFSNPGQVLSVKGNDKIRLLALNYKDAGAQEKAAKLAKDAAKAEILTMIGTAEKVIGDGFSISAGMVGPKHIEYDAEGYRNWRINWKK